jgi:acyl-[acyl-carrier-protein]-phospholipid O-acyltransferase/long-chain-fatty-acid--[acyl-carrier-protein] ligase
MLTLLRLIVRLLFRFRACNTGALRTPGPVLLLPNHVSWFDWLFLGICLDEDWKFVVSSTTAQTSWVHRKIMLNRRTFPVENDSPYAVKHMAEYLQSGGRLVLFPEGRLSPTGCLMKLFDGTGFLIHKTKAKVVVAYLRGANQLKPAVNPGYTRCFPRITAHFSNLLTAPQPEHVSTAVARTKITNWLRGEMVRLQFETEMQFGPRSVPAAIAERVRERPGFEVLEDVTWQPLTYRRLFMGASLLAQQWKVRLSPPDDSTRRELPLPVGRGEGRGEGLDSPLAAVLATASHETPHPRSLSPSDGEREESTSPDKRHRSQSNEHIGVLLPNVAGLPVTLLSLWEAGKVPAILNYTAGPAVMLACAQLAGLKHIVTSRTFLTKAKLDVKPLEQAGVQFHYLEDVRANIGAVAKLLALLRSWFAPASALRTHPQGGDTAVILFTSGSEGVPKGVELSHRNLLANIRQMSAVSDLQDTDRFFTTLPLFHSFGLTVGTLLPLIRGAYVCVYPSPLHYRVVPTVLYDKNATVFLATNTFLAGYARKAHPYDFRSLRYLFAAAEKLQEVTVRTWNEKFGIRVLEGYGATECSPCVSVNMPMTPRPGSVGELLPGMEWKVEPVEGVSEDGSSRREEAHSDNRQSETRSPKPDESILTSAATARTGRLFVRGPNVMKGYLNHDANAKFLALGGWYDTGDIVHVDPDNFLHILGRLKRFAKVSGEMVSLTAVEEALAGAFPHYGLRFAVAVVTKPDEDKGERLIAVTNEPKLTLEEIRTAIKAKGLSNLAVPREVKAVREIPKLGTGKVNHRELEKVIRET